MQAVQQIIAIIFIILGVFFYTVGTIGLIRMPDVFCRLHATTKCDTMGSGLSLLGVIIYYGFSIVSLKMFIIMMFIFLTTPTASHIIAKAAFNQDPEIHPKDPNPFRKKGDS